jgi:hypothetical protein
VAIFQGSASSGVGSAPGGASCKNLGIPDAKGIGMDSTINKASVPFLTIVMVVIAAVAAKIRATANAQVPEGYEDETGFHFGSPDFKN